MIAGSLSFLLAAAVTPTQPTFEPRLCVSPAPSSTARCGIVRVPEERNHPGKRSIELNIIVLPSGSNPARLPPLFDIDGGPGLPATKNAGFYASNAVARDRDVVMVDQRGTGRSNPLLCPALSAVAPTKPMLPRAEVRHCQTQPQAKADLRFYGTRDAVEDLEDVRNALGYGRIDLFGMSYGTTVALSYMRLFPDRVRAAVLMGTAPPDAMPPQHHAAAGNRALDLTIADCARDPACNTRFPRLRADLDRARDWLAGGKGPLSAELFMERLRTMLYSPQGRAKVPLTIERAARHDLSGLLESPTESGLAVADGMFLAVTCGENLNLMNYDSARAKAAATPFGDYRLRRQREACQGWPRVRLLPDHLALPERTQASVLLISGNMDPVTPPDWAETVARALPRARHIVTPGGGHIPDGLSGLETCLDPLMIAFLDHGDPAALDASCVAAMEAPAYELE